MAREQLEIDWNLVSTLGITNTSKTGQVEVDIRANMSPQEFAVLFAEWIQHGQDQDNQRVGLHNTDPTPEA